MKKGYDFMPVRRLGMGSIQRYLESHGWEKSYSGMEYDQWLKVIDGKVHTFPLDVEGTEEWYMVVAEIIAKCENVPLNNVLKEIMT